MKTIILTMALASCGGSAFAPAEQQAVTSDAAVGAPMPEAGPSDAGQPDTFQPDVAREAAPDAACDTTGTGVIGLLGCPCTKPAELACNGNAQGISTVCTNGVWLMNQQCAPGYCDTAPGEGTQGLCKQAAPGCQDLAPGSIICITNDSVRVYATCGPDLVTSVESYCPVACVPLPDAGPGLYPPGMCR